MDKTSYRIPTLDGWRAIAVLLVIGAHSYEMLINSQTWIGARAASLFSHAGVGVDVFFAISGYLICTLLLQEKVRTGTIDLPAFYIRRAFRILPPMIGYLTIVSLFVILQITPSVTSLDIISSALFFRNYIPDSSWYTGHFWSLSVEEHFYLFVPVILLFLAWKGCIRFALSVVVLCAIIRLGEYLIFPPSKIEFRTEARIDAIMYGAIAALLVHRYRSAIQRLITPIMTFLIVAVALVACVLFPWMPVRRTLIAAVMPIPIIFTVMHPTGWAGRILETKLLQTIGKLSYSLYVWQMMFLVPAARQMPLLQAFPVAFFCIIICAVGSYYLIERPFIRLGHRLAALQGQRLEQTDAR